MKYQDKEVHSIVHVDKDLYRVRVIDINNNEIDLCVNFSDWSTLGIKSIVANRRRKTKTKLYRSIIISFENDDRRYITFKNVDAEVYHIVNAYKTIFIIWCQCIDILKCIELKNTNNVKSLIDNLGYNLLIEQPMNTIYPVVSHNMANKIEFIRHQYKLV